MTRSKVIAKWLVLPMLGMVSVTLPACQTTSKSDVASLTGDTKSEDGEKKLRLKHTTRGRHTYRTDKD